MQPTKGPPLNPSAGPLAQPAKGLSANPSPEPSTQPNDSPPLNLSVGFSTGAAQGKEQGCNLSADEDDYKDQVPDTCYEQGVDVEVIALGKASRQLKRWRVTSTGVTRCCDDGVNELSVTYRNKEYGWVPLEKIACKVATTLSPLPHPWTDLDQNQEALCNTFDDDGLDCISASSAVPSDLGEDEDGLRPESSFTDRGTQLQILVKGESEQLEWLAGTTSGLTRFGDEGDELFVHCEDDTLRWVSYHHVIPIFDDVLLGRVDDDDSAVLSDDLDDDDSSVLSGKQ